MARQRETLNIYNNLQQTPLHLAVLTNLPRLVTLLVSRGAVVDARDRHGNTPLHIACRYGRHYINFVVPNHSDSDKIYSCSKCSTSTDNLILIIIKGEKVNFIIFSKVVN